MVMTGNETVILMIMKKIMIMNMVMAKRTRTIMTE